MLKFLIPVDGSPPSWAALFEAACLAAQKEAEMVLVHVVQEVFQGADLVAPYNDELRKKGQGFLDQARVQLEAAGLNVRARLLKGDPDSGLLTAVEEEAPDLIAMGTHGRSALSRFFLGSLAEEMLSRTPCPMLVTRKECEGLDIEAARRWMGARKVLLGMDGSEHARRAIDILPALMSDGGEVTMLSATDLLYSGQEHLELMRRALEEDSLPALARLPGIQVRFRVENGSAARSLVAVAEEIDADLIVLGTRGRGGLGHALLGSVTREVARCAGCPVLAVHGQSGLLSEV